MASHYVSVSVAATGADRSDMYDMTSGTSSTTADVIELRVLDGAGLSIKDVILTLEKFEQYFENYQLAAGAGFSVNP